MNKEPRATPRRSWLHAVAPGVLIAATGVGAGDLITASLAGTAAGLSLLWAAPVGALFKWTLNEGLARWQLATGTTLLEGWVERLGGWIQWLFLSYLLCWTVITGGAMVSACGVAGAGLYDFGLPLHQAKIIWGIGHSLIGFILVWKGGFQLFERVMSVAIAVMFVTVMVTAVLLRPDWGALARGLFVPRVPEGALPWVLGILGGVGGSVTLMSYGYWIRELHRDGWTGVRACRLDLSIGYVMTALFGIAMVTIGSRLSVSKGDDVALQIAGQLRSALGSVGYWIFLAGFWGAVFSSLLGVWQSIPYLFADFCLLRSGLSAAQRRAVDYARTTPYRVYLVLLTVVSPTLLWLDLKQVQVGYAVLAAWFMPLLALTLLIMNNRTAWVGRRFRSGWWLNAILLATLLFFLYTGYRKIVGILA